MLDSDWGRLRLTCCYCTLSENENEVELRARWGGASLRDPRGGFTCLGRHSMPLTHCVDRQAAKPKPKPKTQIDIDADGDERAQRARHRREKGRRENSKQGAQGEGRRAERR